MKKKPNVVCLISDDTDFKNIGAYGSQLHTPNIDMLAEEGVRFTNFYCASSVCTPSRYSFLTGQYCGRCDDPHFLKENPVSDPYSIEWNTFINRDIPTIGTVFSQNGYRTGYVGKWHTGVPAKEFLEDPLPEDGSLDDPAFRSRVMEYQEIISEKLKKDSGFEYASAVYWDNADHMRSKALRYHNLEYITESAMEFLDSCQDEPFLLYMATTVHHGPTHTESFDKDLSVTHGKALKQKPEECTSRDDLKAKLAEKDLPYDHDSCGMIWLDDQLGALVRKLKKMGVYDNTIIVYKSDHNTEPGKATCYEKGVRIPFILKADGQNKKQGVCTARGQNVDLAPTLFDMCGIDVPENAVLDGVSLKPVVEGRKDEVRDTLYFEMGYARAVLAGKWKYICQRFPQSVIDEMKNGKRTKAPNQLDMPEQDQTYISPLYYPAYFDPDQLYDLENDPAEQNNLAAIPEYQEKLTQMRGLLSGYLQKFDHPFPVEGQDFLYSDRYRELVSESQEPSIDHISWWSEDSFNWSDWKEQMRKME